MVPKTTLKTEFAGKYGRILEQLAGSWGARVQFDVKSRECMLVFIDWITKRGLQAKIGILVDIDYLEIGSFLDGRNVHSDRTRSWGTPPSKLRTRLQKIRDILEDFDSASGSSYDPRKTFDTERTQQLLRLLEKLQELELSGA